MVGTVSIDGVETEIQVAREVDENGNLAGGLLALPGLTGSSTEPVNNELANETELDVEGAENGEAPGMEGVSGEIHEGQQGKHQPGHNNYIPGRSTINEDVDPQELLDGAHSGGHEVVGSSERGDPVVDFGEPSGVDATTGEATQYGTIHSGNDGAHIVPTNPNSIDSDD